MLESFGTTCDDIGIAWLGDLEYNRLGILFLWIWLESMYC